MGGPELFHQVSCFFLMRGLTVDRVLAVGRGRQEHQPSLPPSVRLIMCHIYIHSLFSWSSLLGVRSGCSLVSSLVRGCGTAKEEGGEGEPVGRVLHGWLVPTSCKTRAAHLLSFL